MPKVLIQESPPAAQPSVEIGIVLATTKLPACNIGSTNTRSAGSVALAATAACKPGNAGKPAAPAVADTFSLELTPFGKLVLTNAAGTLNPGKVIPTLHRCAEYGRMHVKKGLLPFPALERF